MPFRNERSRNCLRCWLVITSWCKRVGSHLPAANFNGTDSLVYTIVDGQGGAATALVTIIVSPVNDDPTAIDDSGSVNEDASITLFVLDNDSLTIVSVTDPANGTAVANPDGTITYTPQVDFNGANSFDYTVNDGNGGSDTATVIVIINPVGDTSIYFVSECCTRSFYTKVDEEPLSQGNSSF